MCYMELNVCVHHYEYCILYECWFCNVYKTIHYNIFVFIKSILCDANCVHSHWRKAMFLWTIPKSELIFLKNCNHPRLLRNLSLVAVCNVYSVLVPLVRGHKKVLQFVCDTSQLAKWPRKNDRKKRMHYFFYFKNALCSYNWYVKKKERKYLISPGCFINRYYNLEALVNV